MKKRMFYHIGVKSLLAAVLLAVTVFTGLLGGWVLTGLFHGIGIRDIAYSVPYEMSSMAARYLLEQGNREVTRMTEDERYCPDGSTYDGTATVDISDLGAGVANDKKNKNLEYRLDDLKKFYGTEEYWLLRHLVWSGTSYVTEDPGQGSDGLESEPEGSGGTSYVTEDPGQSSTGLESEPAGSGGTSYVAEDPGQSSDGAVTEPASDGAVTGSAGSGETGGTEEPLGPAARPTGVVETSIEASSYSEDQAWSSVTAEIEKYRSLFNVLYHNGAKAEKRAILNVKGTTIADYALRHPDTVSLLDSYKELLSAAEQIHDYTRQKEQGSNALVYIRNTDTGECLTNVPGWEGLTLAQAVADFEKTYGSASRKTEGLFAWYDEAQDSSAYNVPASTGTNLLNYSKQVLTYWKEQGEGNQTGEIFLGLNTDYPVDDSARTDRDMLRWYREENLFAGSYFSDINMFVLLIAGMAAIVLLLILMACQTGHRPGDREIHLAPIDEFPLEILMAADVVLWIFLICACTLSVSNIDNSADTHMLMRYPYYQAAFCASFCGAVALFAWDLKHYGRRIKAKKPGGSIILSAGKAIRKAAEKLSGTWKENQKLVIFYSGFAVLHFIIVGCAADFLFGREDTRLPGYLLGAALALLDLFILFRLLKIMKGRDEVRKGMDAVARGDLDYQIDTEDLSADNREMAEQINHMRDSLREAVETEMKSERLKTDLITNVSHDIKTPLTSIINYVDILKREHIEDEKIAGYIDVLDRKSQRLKQLTEDLVEASKISSGNITLDMGEINLKQLIMQTNGEFEEKFAARNLELICELPENEMRIRADGRRMFRVIENLYNNVAKYAMPNSRVYVSGEFKEGRVIFSIKNISESPLNFRAEELMERFVRGDVSRNTEGSGLGLEIARNLTVMQQGTFDLYLDGDLFKVTISFDAL